MPSVPSVTMNGSMRPLVISRPCARPNRQPSTTANAMPASTTATGDARRPASAFIMRITQPAISAAIEPTDRSMPPLMMTKHMPTAMIPMKAVRVSTFIALSQVAKSPLSSVPAMHSSTSPTSGPAPSIRWRQRDVRADGGASPVVPRMALVSSGGMGDQLLFAELGGIERGLHDTRPHDDHAVAQADQLDELRRGDDHGAPLRGEPLAREEDVALGAHVDAARGLVEHHHARLGREHLRDGELLLVAARQRRGGRIERARADAEVGHRALERPPPRCAV